MTRKNERNIVIYFKLNLSFTLFQGSCKATGIELSQRGEFEEKTGYWKSVATVKLP